MRIIGYGICGGGEADRYLRETLDEFNRLCDETIILGNKITEKEREMIAEYGFHLVEDDREWGKAQHVIKRDFIENHVAKLNPDVTICLDMDETFANVTREKIEEQFTKGDAWYVYIVNRWNEGWRSDWSFWNVRMWSWAKREELGEAFFKFENRPLHCGLAPKWCYALNLHSPFVLIHKGLMEKKDRDAKIKRYEKYDPRQTYRSPLYYEALAVDEHEELDLDKVIATMERDVALLKQPLNKKIIMATPKDKTLVLREADGLVFDVDTKFLPQQLKKKFKGKGFMEISATPSIPKDQKPLGSGKKTFVYVANHSQDRGDDTEGHITRALEELGHEVIKSDGNNVPDGDVILYHKWIPNPSLKGKKVCWYFDKIDFSSNRKEFFIKMMVNTDRLFTSDHTGADELSIRHDVLRQGVGYDYEEYDEVEGHDVAFVGDLYGKRNEWFLRLKERFDIHLYQRTYGKDLNSVCRATKIMVCPDYPSDDGYWSNRVYDLIGRGAFVIHPYCKDMDIKGLPMYKNGKELNELIDFYLGNPEQREKERDMLVKQVRDKFTYKTRIKELCEKL